MLKSGDTARSLVLSWRVIGLGQILSGVGIYRNTSKHLPPLGECVHGRFLPLGCDVRGLARAPLSIREVESEGVFGHGSSDLSLGVTVVLGVYQRSGSFQRVLASILQSRWLCYLNGFVCMLIEPAGTCNWTRSTCMCQDHPLELT